MEKTITFKVEVIGFNAEVFESNYGGYITNKSKDYFDTVVFTLTAPQSVYEEIGTLEEELIYII